MGTEPNNVNGTPRGARLIFGIFMIVVYLGMGILCLIGTFDVIITKKWMANSLGCLFALYGLWRGYRLYKGMN